MPWLTIIMAILTFFAAGGADKEKRAKAALIAAGVGAATYATTHHTDWGKTNLGQLDGVEIATDANGVATAQTGVTGEKQPISGDASSGSAQSSGSNGFWTAATGWLTSPAGQVTTGAVGAKAAGIPNWLILAGAGLAAFLILKD